MKLNHRLKVWLLRYVPSLVSSGYVTIAILVEEDGTGTFASVRFIADWSRLLALDPMVDLEYLESLKQEVEDAWSDKGERQRVIRLLEDTLSNTLQVVQSPTVATDIQPEMERLVKLNLEQAA